MMKMTTIATAISIAALMSLCVLSPASCAASMEEDQTVSFKTDYSYLQTALASDMTLKAETGGGALCDEVYICTESQYEAFRRGETPEPTGIVVGPGGKAGVNGTYWVIAENGSYLHETISGATIANSMTVMNLAKYTFTVMQKSSADVSIRFSGNTHPLNVIVIDDHASASITAYGVKSYTGKDAMYKETGITGNGVDFSFSCKNTSTYALFIESENSQDIEVSVTVDGIADYINSTALAIVLIVMAVAVVGGLVFIATKKVI